MEKVDVNLKKARGFLTLKSDARLEPEQMRLAVVKAGFTPRDVTFTAVGHLVQQEGKALFNVQGSGQLIPQRIAAVEREPWRSSRDEP